MPTDSSHRDDLIHAEIKLTGFLGGKKEKKKKKEEKGKSTTSKTQSYTGKGLENN